MMKCPFCKCSLIPGEERRYETLCDHVSDPNCTSHPLRPTFVCVCKLAKGAFWDEVGDYYNSNKEWSYDVYCSLRKSHGDKLDNGNLHAIGSFSWKGIREYRRREWMKKHLPFYRRWLHWRWNRLAKKYHWLGKGV